MPLTHGPIAEVPDGQTKKVTLCRFFKVSKLVIEPNKKREIKNKASAKNGVFVDVFC